MATALWVLLVIVLLMLLWLIATFNDLVRSRNRTDEAWADIDVQLKRRHDLIPNLVATVKGYAAHEAGVFERVTQARSRAMQAAKPAEHAQAENMLTDALKSLFAVAENYPELKASANFAKLQDELSDTENKIQAARRFYNGNVRDYNTKLQVFPTNFIASTMRFTPREYFGTETAQDREPVEVKF